jgi:hypothetical protein
VAGRCISSGVRKIGLLRRKNHPLKSSTWDHTISHSTKTEKVYHINRALKYA